MTTIILSLIRKPHILPILILFLFSYRIQSIDAQQNHDLHIIVPRTIDLSLYLHPSYDAGIVGILNKDTLLTTKSPGSGRATIDFWDINTKKIITSILPPSPIDFRSTAISPDGLYMISLQEVATYLHDPVYNPHVIYLWNLQKRKLIHEINLGQYAHAFSLCCLPGKPDRAIVTEDPTNDATNFPQFLILDCQTGHLIQTARYEQATIITLNTSLFSPDGKVMIGLYPAEEGHPYGSFDLFDAQNLHLLYSFDGSKTQNVINEPAFFISRNKLLFGNTLYDMRTRQVSSVLPSHSNLRVFCLSSVPTHPGYGLFVVQAGKAEPNLEIWDIISNRKINQWSLPRQSSLIPLKKGKKANQTEPVNLTTGYISRDGQAFGVIDNNGKIYIYGYDFNALPPTATR